MFRVLVQYYDLFLRGFVTTLQLLGSIMLMGIPSGILLGILGGRYSKELGGIIKNTRFLTKVIPVLVLLFWLHYPLQSLLGVVVNPFWTAVFALGLLNIISTASVITIELELLPKAYREAGVTLGLSPSQIITRIELPLLARRSAPQLLLNQAAMLEYTLFASLISVPELFRTAQSINAMVYKPVEIYSLLIIFFLIILAPLHVLVRFLENRYMVQYD